MQQKVKAILQAISAFFRWESSDRELLQAVSLKVMGTTIGTYLVWHITATLVWPQYFSPSIYFVTAEMIVTAILTYVLVQRIYLLGQTTWFLGLVLSILTAYSIYGKPEIFLLLALLPIMAEVMLGIRPALVLDVFICLIPVAWQALPTPMPLKANYELVVILSIIASTALGWGITDNLVTSIEAASFHYREAVQRLNEAREHRAEISVLLKDVNKANYQLDRLNRMLIFSRAQAEEAREERNRFAMAVSHELRSPLNFIIGFSDLMVNSPETYAKITNWPRGLYDDIREIYKSSTHLMSLINDILDMGKMDAQQMTLFKEKIDFALIFEDVRQMVHSAVESKGLELKIELQPDLPLVYVDRTRIRQVLLNLVTNSLRFTRYISLITQQPHFARQTDPFQRAIATLGLLIERRRQAAGREQGEGAGHRALGAGAQLGGKDDGLSAARSPVEDLALGDGLAGALLQTEGLGAQLDVVVEPAAQAPMLVFDRL